MICGWQKTNKIRKKSFPYTICVDIAVRGATGKGFTQRK